MTQNKAKKAAKNKAKWCAMRHTSRKSCRAVADRIEKAAETRVRREGKRQALDY